MASLAVVCRVHHSVRLSPLLGNGLGRSLLRLSVHKCPDKPDAAAHLPRDIGPCSLTLSRDGRDVTAPGYPDARRHLPATTIASITVGRI
jgi:hypothetical protein